VIGIKLVKRFKEDQYRKFILIMTAIGAVAILIK